MKKLFLAILLISISTTTFGQEKLKTTSGHIKFFSTTPAEDIEANNYKAISNLTPTTGDLVFSIPMQSFEFKNFFDAETLQFKEIFKHKKVSKSKI